MEVKGLKQPDNCVRTDCNLPKGSQELREINDKLNTELQKTHERYADPEKNKDELTRQNSSLNIEVKELNKKLELEHREVIGELEKVKILDKKLNKITDEYTDYRKENPDKFTATEDMYDIRKDFKRHKKELKEKQSEKKQLDKEIERLLLYGAELKGKYKALTAKYNRDLEELRHLESQIKDKREWLSDILSKGIKIEKKLKPLKDLQPKDYNVQVIKKRKKIKTVMYIMFGVIVIIIGVLIFMFRQKLFGG